MKRTGAPAAALEVNRIHQGDARELLPRVVPESVALSVWSPPYFVGKSYEAGWTFDEWRELLETVIAGHYRLLKPGGFLAVNIADILCFPDPEMPKIQAENISRKSRLPVTREDIERVSRAHPDWNRYQIAAHLGVSEQTVDRRLNHNNIRGGKHSVQTRVLLTGSLVAEAAQRAQLFLYDRRVWVKDAAWENSRWHTNSYRAVDEFEYVYIFWKPGITRVDRQRLDAAEWAEWGSRGVWHIDSVRRNDDHEAKFPVELPRRLIRLLTDPGEIVLDPFVGSGTSAVAALELQRQFIGIDAEPRYVRLARRRVDEARARIPGR